MNNFARRVFTPTELNRDVRVHLEAGFGLVDVEGEISNLARPASGHLYFSIKDQKTQIRCAMFRNRATLMNTRLSNGQQVRATARVSLYEPRGDYQLIVERIEAAGEGRLRQLYEQLKRQLSAEGLFDPSRKQALPVLPRRIGLITSASGAAVRDLLHVLQRRFPLAHIRLYPSAVQGQEAPGELQRALHLAIDDGFADVLIIGRGGGSLEDLWAFNDEALVRQVAACPLPIVSAVGHEVDFSLCDEAADVRAPTPSAAAEMVSPDQWVLQQRIGQLRARLQRDQSRRLDYIAQRLDHIRHRLQNAHPRQQLQQQYQRLAQLQARLQQQTDNRIRVSQHRFALAEQRLQHHDPAPRMMQARQHIQHLQNRLRDRSEYLLSQKQQNFAALIRSLHQLSPLAVLARGYALNTDAESGQVIQQHQAMKVGQEIRIIGRDYEAQATITALTKKPDTPDAV